MLLSTGESRIEQLIDDAPITKLQVTTFFLCFCVAAFDGYDIGTVSSMAPLIAEHFHVSVRGFGPLFSIGFFGMTIGALLVGPAADRLGRKVAIIASTFVFGLFTLLIAFAPSPHVLLGLRFVAGIGLGGALPNTIALTSEYAPRRARAFIVTLMASGITVGGILAPVVGSYIGPRFGWGASFIIGGGLPIALCVALLAALPESLRFLVVRQRPVAQLQALLLRIDGARSLEIAEASAATSPMSGSMPIPGTKPARGGVAQLFTERLLPSTILLWAVFFCTLLTALFIVSWLPAVLRSGGLRISSALLLASLFSVGGLIGSPTLGRLTDRVGPYVVLVPCYLGAALFTSQIGSLHALVPLALVIAGAGFFVFGAQGCIQALAAGLYPTPIRAAGLGWAFGIGRLGSIIGPLFGGMMIQSHWPVAGVFHGAALPPLVAALSAGLMWLTTRGMTGLDRELGPEFETGAPATHPAAPDAYDAGRSIPDDRHARAR